MLATVELDTFAAGAQLARAGFSTAVLNFANEYNCGGAWFYGRGSQEEALMRCSSLPLSLWPHRRLDEHRFSQYDSGLPRASRPCYPWVAEAAVLYTPGIRPVGARMQIHRTRTPLCGASFHSF